MLTNRHIQIIVSVFESVVTILILWGKQKLIFKIIILTYAVHLKKKIGPDKLKAPNLYDFHVPAS